MRKYFIFAAITCSVLLLAGCGRQQLGNNDNNTSSEEKTTVSEAETTVSSTSTVTTVTVTTTAVTTTSKADTSDEFIGFEGYWFIDGDPSLASMHITRDGRFTTYYASGNVENTGYIRHEFDTELNNYIYLMYLDSGELYEAFADDGEEYKTDIYIGNGGYPHYVKLYGEGGLGDDGRGAGEVDTDVLAGTWRCGEVLMTIEDRGEGIFHATITYRDTSARMTWDYPLIFDNGLLVCDKQGELSTTAELPGDAPYSGVVYNDASADFEQTPDGGLIWNEYKDNTGQGMVFYRIND